MTCIADNCIKYYLMSTGKGRITIGQLDRELKKLKEVQSQSQPSQVTIKQMQVEIRELKEKLASQPSTHSGCLIDRVESVDFS